MCKIKSEITKRLSEQHNIKIDESKPLKKEYDNSFNELDALDQYYIISVLSVNLYNLIFCVAYVLQSRLQHEFG